MKKIILSLVVLVVIVITAGLFYLFTNLDAIVKGAIEKYGSEATQTAVRVDRVRIKLTEGDGAIYELSVANPEGFDLPHAITLGETGMGIDLKSVREEPYVINHVTVREPGVFFEINADKKANLYELKKNLVASRAAGEDKSGSEKADAQQPRLIIRRLTFEQGRVIAKVTPLDKEYNLELPAIHMTDLGGSQGTTASELTREILQRLIDTAIKEIRKKGIDAELDKLETEAREKVEEEKAKMKDKADSEIEKEKKKAEDKLKNMLQ